VTVDGALLRDLDLTTAAYERMRHRVPGRHLMRQVSGAARPSGALRAIDSTAWPRSRRTCGPRRLRRRSPPDLVATQGGAVGVASKTNHGCGNLRKIGYSSQSHLSFDSGKVYAMPVLAGRSGRPPKQRASWLYPSGQADPCDERSCQQLHIVPFACLPHQRPETKNRMGISNTDACSLAGESPNTKGWWR
jgi:hypothetical protein